MAEAAITARLRADADVAATVGRSIFPVIAPQNKPLPFIVYQRVTSEHLHSFDGITGLARGSYQIDCYAETYKQAKNLSDDVRLALDAFTGTVGGVVVQATTLINMRDEVTQPQHAQERPVYRVSLDFDIWYEESTS